MLIKLFLFLLGFVLLIKGADFLVDGSSSLARRLGISSLVIGLTVVAFGTSAPELVVNLIAASKDSTDLAIGNILGSNIANSLLILGAAAIIYPVSVKESTIWKELPFSLLAVVVLFFVANDYLLDGAPISQVTRSDGFVMLAFFVLFIAYLFSIAKDGILDKPIDHEHVKIFPVWLSSTMVIAGLIGLILGGKWIVEGALFFGERMGLSEAFMGLTVVAIGTSLPELATAVVAARKKHSDIVIGNVIGSNIFNILMVLAVTATVKPLVFSSALNQDIIVVVVVTFILFIFLLQGDDQTKNKLTRWQGAICVLVYFMYIGYLTYRG